MKMTITEKLIRIGLILMVLLSLYFSYSIWSSSSIKEDSLENEGQVTSTTKERSSSDVFLPLRIVRMENDEITVSTSESLISSIQKVLSSSIIDQLSLVSSGSEEEYENYYSDKRGFEFLYEGRFLLSEYLSVYNLPIDLTDISLAEEVYFSSIQVDFDGKRIYFFDFENKNVYSAFISIDQEKIENLLKKDGINYFKAIERSSIANKQYYMMSDLKLKKYSYILASQPITLFRNAFFANPDSVHTNEDSNDLSYTSGVEKLVIDEETSTVYFSGNLQVSSEDHNVYADSFGYMKKLGTNIGNIRYFDYSDNKVNYRTFVEGFPVFSENNKGQVKVTIDGEESEQHKISIDTSVDMIQVPIPSEEEVTLQDTSDLLDELLAYGADIEGIESLIIGYSWQTIEGITQVVDLTPEWYILYRGQWYPERELLQKIVNLEVQ
ncbi:two-component system activity regulator YycH [Enterococcus sp. BWT-B8]|uniref:YycH family regulatory protein n=1 Tax=unclassified Enterococcus TaxID=2608891 RepID=UPI001E4E2273|nr:MULTISPECIES: two-component system activity regulator YycH [unclassified Enterococcus]MCB5950985.1 two-component system activity regulator YycH [Enterococcus sp. BWT-B8]